MSHAVRGVCTSVCVCVLKLRLTAGSSHISFLSPLLCQTSCAFGFHMTADFCLPSFALASAVFFPHSLCAHSLLFVGFYQLQSCSFLASPSTSPGIWWISPPSPKTPSPLSNIYVGLSIKLLILFLLHKDEWLGSQVVWCICTCLPYTKKERERLSCVASNCFLLMGLVDLSPVTTNI